jgi:hypothetical protein
MKVGDTTDVITRLYFYSAINCIPSNSKAETNRQTFDVTGNERIGNQPNNRVSLTTDPMIVTSI